MKRYREKSFKKNITPGVKNLGYSKVVNSQTVTVLEENLSGYITRVSFAGAITDGGAGYAKECTHYDRTNGNTYRNDGTTTSCDFNLVETTDAVVTGVTAGTGLSGGGTEGTVTLDATTALQTKYVDTNIPAMTAPTGSDQADIDRVIFKAPTACTITSVEVLSDTATTGSDATNHYEFNVYNSTQTNELGAANTSTVSTEITADTHYALTVDQNATLAADDVLTLRTDILDDGSAGPTDLSGANVRVIINYTAG